jgi:hypothetical protein
VAAAIIGAMLARTLAALALLAALPAAAQESTVRFRGYAYELDSGRFIYTELHEQRLDGERWLGGSVAYHAPDGSRFAYKTLDLTRDPHLPLYRLEITGRKGTYVEGIADITPERIEMFRQGYGEDEPRRKSVARPPVVTADSGFHPFLQDHFAALKRGGAPLPFRFAVASELDTFMFRARRVEDAEFEGRRAARFVIEPDSMLRWLVDPLEVMFSPEQRLMLEYRGRSNIHDPQSGKPYVTRVIYPSKRPDDAPELVVAE